MHMYFTSELTRNGPLLRQGKGCIILPGWQRSSRRAEPYKGPDLMNQAAQKSILRNLAAALPTPKR